MFRQATQHLSHNLYTYDLYSYAPDPANQRTRMGTTVVTRRRHRLPCAPLQVPHEQPHHKVHYHTLCAEVTLDGLCFKPGAIQANAPSGLSHTQNIWWPTTHTSSNLSAQHNPRMQLEQHVRRSTSHKLSAQHNRCDQTGAKDAQRSTHPTTAKACF
jgi:hypothetical protein